MSVHDSISSAREGATVATFDLAAVNHSLAIPSSRPLELAQARCHTCAAEAHSQRTSLGCRETVIQQRCVTRVANIPGPRCDGDRSAQKRATSPPSPCRPSMWAEADSHMARCVIVMLLERLPSGSFLHTLVSRST